MLNDSHANARITRLAKDVVKRYSKAWDKIRKPINKIGRDRGGPADSAALVTGMSLAGQFGRLGYRDDFGLLRPT